MAFVHVNVFVNDEIACASQCERVWLGIRTRWKRVCVIRCIWAVLYQRKILYLSSCQKAQLLLFVAKVVSIAANPAAQK